MPGLSELVLFLIVVLFIFGASKLPAIATAIGKVILKTRQHTPDEDSSRPQNEESKPPAS